MNSEENKASFEDSLSVSPTNSDEDKYWRFIGQDWKWMKLSDEDFKWCESIGKRRNASRQGSRNNFAKDDAEKGHIHGVVGELAVHRYFDLPINQLTTLKNNSLPDVGNFEVKTTKYKANWRIYCNESNRKLEREYILVLTCFYPNYVAIMGKIFGFDIKNGPDQMSFRSREKAYWASWHDLRNV
jgi:hypothetical protein